MQVLLAIFSTFCVIQLGHAGVKEFVVGGERAYSGEFPFQVSIRYKDRHRCGGSLITPRHVLTAAHCLVNYLEGGKFANQLDQVSVVLRSVNLLLKGDRYSVETIYPHEKYDPEMVFNDIGIMQLEKNVTLSKYANVIKLPDLLQVESNTSVQMIGFGTYYTGDPVAKHHPVSLFLRKVEVPVIGLKKCQDLWGDEADIKETNICTSTDNELGSCVGDSGGALVLNGTIQGIISYGESNCAEGTPDVHTNVAWYRGWIDSTLKRLESTNDTEPISTTENVDDIIANYLTTAETITTQAPNKVSTTTETITTEAPNKVSTTTETITTEAPNKVSTTTETITTEAPNKVSTTETVPTSAESNTEKMSEKVEIIENEATSESTVIELVTLILPEKP